MNEIIISGSIKLQDDFLVKIEEGSRNITVELRQDPAAFPEPTLFSWSKDGQPLSATELALTYSSVTIDTVRRADAGNYTITATNFVLPGSLVANQVSNDTGSFYLDVICKLHKSLHNALDFKDNECTGVQNPHRYTHA